MGQKTITDEQLIAALMSNGTIKAASSAVGLSERAIYDRMNRGDFQELYKAAKADLLRGAVITLNGHLQDAITTIAGIMADTENNPAVRLQAAQTIPNTAGKFTGRLQEDETAVMTQHEQNRFNIFD